MESAMCPLLFFALWHFLLFRLAACDSNYTTVSGHVYIKDQKYRATCNCPSCEFCPTSKCACTDVSSLEHMITLNSELCGPCKIKVKTHGSTSAADDLVLFQNFSLVPPTDFVKVSDYHISSMDGRATEKGFFAPGGDLGVFIHVVLGFFASANATTEADMTNLLRQYIESMPENRRFYHCTDKTTLKSLCEKLGWDAIDLENIDVSNQSKIKQMLTNVPYGDAYLNFLLEQNRLTPSKYKLIEWCVNAYFNILWDKSNVLWQRLIFDVIEGDFNPSALVEIAVSRGVGLRANSNTTLQCEIVGKAPLLVPRVGHRQYLFYTDYASIARIRDIASFVYKTISHENKLPLEDFIYMLEKFTHVQIEEFSKLPSRCLAYEYS